MTINNQKDKSFKPSEGQEKFELWIKQVRLQKPPQPPQDLEESSFKAWLEYKHKQEDVVLAKTKVTISENTNMPFGYTPSKKEFSLVAQLHKVRDELRRWGTGLSILSSRQIAWAALVVLVLVPFYFFFLTSNQQETASHSVKVQVVQSQPHSTGQSKSSVHGVATQKLQGDNKNATILAAQQVQKSKNQTSNSAAYKSSVQKGEEVIPEPGIEQRGVQPAPVLLSQNKQVHENSSTSQVHRVQEEQNHVYTSSRTTLTPKGSVEFRLNSPQARQVNLVGNFNKWDKQQHQMKQDEKGDWVLSLQLPQGSYEYQFLIDGHIWQFDPNNLQLVDDGFGGINSVLTI